MKIPRDLSGKELIAALCKRWGYRQVHQTGSHIILETEIPGHQRIAIPDHTYLRIGMLNAILRTVADHKRVAKDSILDSL